MRVEKLDAAVGETVELDKVSMLAKDEGVVVDPKALESAKVVAEVVEQDRAKKIPRFQVQAPEKLPSHLRSSPVLHRVAHSRDRRLAHTAEYERTPPGRRGYGPGRMIE